MAGVFIFIEKSCFPIATLTTANVDERVRGPFFPTATERAALLHLAVSAIRHSRQTIESNQHQFLRFAVAPGLSGGRMDDFNEVEAMTAVTVYYTFTT